MKKLCLLLFAFITSCPVLALSPEAEFVERFVNDMNNGREHGHYISPKFLKKYGLTASTVNLDGYSYGSVPDIHIQIVSDKPPFVVAEISNSRFGWANTMRYRVIKEEGNLVIVPPAGPRRKGEYINPWIEDVRTMWMHKETTRAEQLEAARIEAERRTNREKELLREQAWAKTLREGDETSCGPVLEVKKSLVKVYFPVQNYGNEHWININKIKPPGNKCRFKNGRYVD